MTPMTTPIEAYAVLGDTRTAALVSDAGAIDWLCFPRFDSEPVFARLIGGPDGGHFTIAPESWANVRRRYVGTSVVLETTWQVDGSEVVVTDAMVADVRSGLLPRSLLVRRVEVRGEPAKILVTIDPRDGWSHRPMAAERRHGALLFSGAGGRVLAVVTDAPGTELSPGTEQVVQVEPGRPVTFVLGLDEAAPAVLVPPSVASQHVAATAAWWEDWSSGVRHSGPFRDLVLRSLVTLRILTYAPSGAPVAAPTTSLPEIPGGEGNWDYRYAWPRDAALGAISFARLGKLEEAEAFFYWSLHAGRLTRPRINVLYDIMGGTRVSERELALPGWEGSRPVRIGNAAAEQFQLDVYGWVLAAAAAVDRAGGRLWRETRRSLRGFASFVAEHWREPDHGIWELRDQKRHYVHSKAMAWLALRCMGELEDPRSSERTSWWQACDAIADETRKRGCDGGEGGYTVAFGIPTTDASLLLLPWTGIDGTHGDRLSATVGRVRRELEVEPGLVYRHVDGPGGNDPSGMEGAFVACSFWLAQALAILGRIDEAHEVFGVAAAKVNDVGLLSEEIEPGSGRFLGNFPQALSHSALILAALDLEALQEKRQGERNVPRSAPNST